MDNLVFICYIVQLCLWENMASTLRFLFTFFGGVAQLGERLPCKQEVSGSIPLISTIFLLHQY
jgi:hypothetical protein